MIKATGQEILERGADILGKAGVALSPAAPDGIHVESEGSAFSHPGEHADHAHVRYRSRNSLRCVFRVGVIKRDGKFNAIEMPVSWFDEPGFHRHIHVIIPPLRWAYCQTLKDRTGLTTGAKPYLLRLPSGVASYAKQRKKSR